MERRFFIRAMLGSVLCLGASVASPAFAEGHSTSGAADLTSSGFPGSPTAAGGGNRSAGRGAGDTYKRNETATKLLNPSALEGISKAGPETAKAIADSQNKFSQQISQITSQQIDAGKDVINQLASAIPAADALVASPESFQGLAQAQQQLAQTTTQLFQIQSQGILQQAAPQPTEPPQRTLLVDRLRNAPNRPFAGTQTKIQRVPGQTGFLNGGGLTNLPQAYKAPR